MEYKPYFIIICMYVVLYTFNNLISFQLHFRKLRQRPKDLTAMIHGTKLEPLNLRFLRLFFYLQLIAFIEYLWHLENSIENSNE